VSPPTPSGAAVARCAQLTKDLPATVEGLSSRPTRPRSPYSHAWGKSAVVLRCGVARPAGYVAGAEVTIVDGVRWFEQTGSATVTWTALRPNVHVALSLPTSYQDQGAFLVDLATPLKRALP
jgi:hypothetical protein